MAKLIGTRQFMLHFMTEPNKDGQETLVPAPVLGHKEKPPPHLLSYIHITTIP